MSVRSQHTAALWLSFVGILVSLPLFALLTYPPVEELELFQFGFTYTQYNKNSWCIFEIWSLSGEVHVVGTGSGDKGIKQSTGVATSDGRVYFYDVSFNKHFKSVWARKNLVYFWLDQASILLQKWNVCVANACVGRTEHLFNLLLITGTNRTWGSCEYEQLAERKNEIDCSFSIFHNNVFSTNRNLENLQTHILDELNFRFNIIGVPETNRVYLGVRTSEVFLYL